MTRKDIEAAGEVGLEWAVDGPAGGPALITTGDGRSMGANMPHLLVDGPTMIANLVRLLDAIDSESVGEVVIVANEIKDDMTEAFGICFPDLDEA